MFEGMGRRSVMRGDGEGWDVYKASSPRFSQSGVVFSGVTCSRLATRQKILYGDTNLISGAVWVVARAFE